MKVEPNNIQVRHVHTSPLRPSTVGHEPPPAGFMLELGKRASEWLDWRAGLRPEPQWHKRKKR